MNYSVALTAPLHAAAQRHLLRTDGQEDLCFGLWKPSSGSGRRTAILGELLPPRKGERVVHGNAAFLPPYLERAIGSARRASSGVCFMHSHPGPGWQSMSDDDVRAERDNAGAIGAATGLPLVGLTLGTDGAWSGRFWIRSAPRTYTRHWCESVRVVGDWLEITRPPGVGKPPPRPEQERSVAAWGPCVQDRLAHLRVGVIGCGSVGSVVAESLARVGVGHILLMDFDLLAPVNLDRTLHAYSEDCGRPKAEILALAVRRSATVSTPDITPSQWSIGEEAGLRVALDCDVLFSCVDRPWARSVLNHIALSHLIPVVDGGIALEQWTGHDGILRADWRAHTVTPTRRCMECLGQYDPGDVQADREGWFEDPGYVRNLPEDHPIKRNENVFPFTTSVASLEVLQFLALVVPMPGRRHHGAQSFHYVPGVLDKDVGPCKDSCFPHKLLGQGDRTGLVVTARHPSAERARASHP